jgi:uncharacterized protein
VKTRLIGTLTAEAAAALHQAFLSDLVAELARGRYDLELAWALQPGEAPPELGLPWQAQQGEDLGERLWQGLAALAARYPWVAAVGSDHPHLTAARVEEAFELLEAGAQVVLGPADDGGYYLVALAAEALRHELFEGIAWSTASVLGATLERCAALGLRTELLAPSSDVDTGEDLARLVAHLGSTAAGCPETRRLLSSWGRL